MQLFKELQRRNVVRVTIGYIVSCWLLIQVADIVLETIGAPAWVMQTIMLVLALGFPVVVFFSWAYEVTPEGIKHQSEVDRNQSITHVTGRKLDRAIFTMLVIALGYFIWEARFAKDQPGETTEIAVMSERPPAETQEQSAAVMDRKSIAVLPFDSRSTREEDRFFTDGIHDDLLTTLARIGSMKVISRTSVMEYRDTNKKIPEIATELGVAHIMEGAVQRSGNQVRINVQLIDAKTDEHVWAEIYDRELTAENLFAIQSEISTQIAAALQATLSQGETRMVNRVPTQNLDAYEAYQRGKQLMATRVTANLKQATREFSKAVELDPQFALAWVGVADSNYLLALYTDSPMSETIATREEAIGKALALDPGLGEAYASLAIIHGYYGREEEMEAAYRKAIELNPNYATAYQWYSTSLADDPARSLDLLLKAAELDPRSPIIGANLAAEYFDQGLYSRGEQQALKIVELYPDSPVGHHQLVDYYMMRVGEYAKAMRHARELARIDPGDFDALRHQMESYIAVDDLEAAAEVRQKLIDMNPDHYWAGWGDLLIAMIKNNPPAIRESGNWLLQHADDEELKFRWVGAAMLEAGDTAMARKLFLQFEPGWLEPDQWGRLIRSDAELGCYMSWILIHTGEPDQGKMLVDQTLNYLENDLPVITEHWDQSALDTCYLVAGETDKALAILEMQLEHGHIFFWKTRHQLPMYAPLYQEPAYRALLEKRGQWLAEQRELIAKLDSEND